jgi:hypothetical protein
MLVNQAGRLSIEEEDGLHVWLFGGSDRRNAIGGHTFDGPR